MKRFHLVVLSAIVLVLAVSPVSTKAQDPEEATERPSTFESDQDSYIIGTGDLLEIITWKEPDFSREVSVRLDGKITLPLLDDLQAAGKKPMELKQEIQERIQEYMEDPIITVIVKSQESQKFYILGEVSSTGEYSLRKSLTVLQAFTLAGGFTEWASKREIILLRREEGQERIIRIDYKNIIKGDDFSQNVFIRANDTIIVP